VSLVIDEHRGYISDPCRLAAYEAAISSVVREGDVVLDLASGTGILGLLACRAGASRLYSIDSGGVISLARKISRENGFADRTTFVKGVSTHVGLPEQVDVVVADQIYGLGFEAGIVEYFADAWRRFLKPGGRVIPESVDLHVALVDDPALFAQVEAWESNPCGFDFNSVRETAANTVYLVKLQSSSLLSSPAAVISIDLTRSPTRLLQGRVMLEAAKDGLLHGVAGWFEAQLAPGVTMTNSPLSAQRINRPQVYLPIDASIPVKAGDSVSVRISMAPLEELATWTVEIPSAGRVFRHSTFKGMLLPEEDLLHTHPDFVPRLNKNGLARQAALALCDGSRSRAQIELDLVARHPDLFPSPEEASNAVSQVLSKYVE
jgi:Ribosomal protein L11 methyltransferase (PrmA)